jgi:hypothetical protein
VTNPASQQPAPIPEDKYGLAGKRATELHIPEEWRTDYIAIQVALWGSPNSSGSYPMERALAAMECIAALSAPLGTPGRDKP